MLSDKRILVTGGTGLVGSNLKTYLPNAIFVSSKEADLTDASQAKYLISSYAPDVVIHLASKVGGLEYNLKNQLALLSDNIKINVNVFDSVSSLKVPRFISLLSTCIYPEFEKDEYPLGEGQMLLGEPPQSNYGYAMSKRILANLIDISNEKNGTQYNYLIPCNLYGGYDSFDENKSHFVAALLKKIYYASINDKNEIELLGDGTPKRQFLYVEDLCRIIMYCVEHDITQSFNVCGNENLSIDEMARCALKSLNKEHIKINYLNDGKNGQLRKDVSNGKLKSIFRDFNFTPFEMGVIKTWNHFLINKK